MENKFSDFQLKALQTRFNELICSYGSEINELAGLEADDFATKIYKNDGGFILELGFFDYEDIDDNEEFEELVNRSRIENIEIFKEKLGEEINNDNIVNWHEGIYNFEHLTDLQNIVESLEQQLKTRKL